ncbi:MAG: hypothetical protein AB4058_18110 [Microcystaceae cyanobacterium]
MTTEEKLLETWRILDESQQEQVFQFINLLKRTNSFKQESHNFAPEEKAQRWEDWARSHQKRGFSLPDEALHRDSIYED